jgi:hypothetical protein
VDGAQLIRLSRELEPEVQLDLSMTPGTTPVIAADDNDGVWVSIDARIGHFSFAGAYITGWQVESVISSIAVGGPNAVFIASEDGIARYSNAGELLGTTGSDALNCVKTTTLLLDRAGGYLWATCDTTALQFDLIGNSAITARVALPQSRVAVGVDAASGVLWTLANDNLIGFDRSGSVASSIAISPLTLNGPRLLSTDFHGRLLWIGDLVGIVALNPELVQWIRISAGDPLLAIASPSLWVTPGLTTLTPSDAPGTIDFQTSALCNGQPCIATSRYLDTLHVDASVDGVDLGGQVMKMTGAVDSSIVRLPDLMSSGVLRLSATDIYGNRSDQIEIDLDRAQSGGTSPRRKANSPPTVSITAPANNATFVAPATITIAANASDSDGTIAKVEFYHDGVLLGTDTTAPYSYSWANVAVGTYKLTAKAYDNGGASTVSAIVNIQVKANVPPTVTLTAPVNNSKYTAPATINLAATASDSDGSVTKVEFYRGGTTKIATVTTPPYTYSWTNVAAGSYSLTAKATDDKGAVTTSTAVNVSVNNPPTVRITAPANNSTAVAPASMTIQATASDTDGTISKVEFYRNGVLLGTDTTSPYSYAWNNVGVGTYSWTAKATDNLGATTLSSAVTVTVNANQPPTVTLTSPSNGAVIVSGVQVTLAATASDADGSITKVDFYAQDSVVGSRNIGTDATSPYSFTTSSFNLGTNTLTAVATDNKGATTTSAPIVVTVAPNQLPSVTLTAPLDAQVFPSASPPDITLSATAADPDGTITQVSFYAQSTDTPMLLGTVTSPPYQFVWHAVPNTLSCDRNGICVPPGAPANYTIWAEATDNAGGVSDSSFATITVPSVSPWNLAISAPDPNSTVALDAPATLTLASIPSAASSVGDLVAKVEFLADGALLGVVSTPNGAGGEYALIWRNVPTGTHSVTAKLTDAAGLTTVSDPLTVTVRNPNQAPAVTVNGPINEQYYFVDPSDVSIAVSATDHDGAVNYVGVLVDGTELFNSTTASYSGTWSGVAHGVHTVAGRAVDSGGKQTIGRPNYIQIASTPRRPAVVLTSPSPSGSYSTFAPITLTAEAKGLDTPVTKVEFYLGGSLLATKTGAPFTTTVSLGASSYSLQARAYLANGSSTLSSPVSITVSGSNLPPTINLTSPSTGQLFAPGSNIALAANASDPDGSVAKVEFLSGSSVIATVSTPPYAATWTNVATGAYALAARATDNRGATTTSAVANIAVDNPPQVTLTAPRDGDVFAAGQNIALGANATDSDGTITKVEFFAGTTLVGTANSSPFTLSWNNVSAGAYAITAKATDNTGISTTSAVANISVVAAMSASIDSPAAGASFAQGQPIFIRCRASAPGHSISKVDFYADGSLIGSVPFGSSSTVTATLGWSGAPAGAHNLVAKALTTDGLTLTASTVSVTVSDLAVSLIEPFAGQTYVAPGDIRLRAYPTTSTGSIVKVEFFQGAMLLGTVTSPPYAFVWPAVSSGSYSVSTRATDSSGLVVTSPATSVVVVSAPTLGVDAGIDGSSMGDDRATISGVIQAPVNSSVIVNGRGAALDRQGRYFLDNVILVPGVNTITLALATQDAPLITRTIALTSTSVAPFTVAVSPDTGLAPLSTRMTIVNRGAVPFQRIEIDTNDDGVAEQILTGLTNNEAVLDLSLTDPGLYTIRVTVFDALNNVIYLARRKIRVYSPAELGSTILGVYQTMVDRLAANNPSAALNCFTGDAAAIYSGVFNALGGSLPTVASQLGRLVDGVISQDTAELTIVRDTSGGPQAFMIYMLRGGDGIWRIESM